MCGATPTHPHVDEGKAPGGAHPGGPPGGGGGHAPGMMPLGATTTLGGAALAAAARAAFFCECETARPTAIGRTTSPKTSPTARATTVEVATAVGGAS
jgi:hypothetical protein